MNAERWLAENANDDDIIPGAIYERDTGICYGVGLAVRRVETDGRWHIYNEDALLTHIESEIAAEVAKWQAD